ncbi:MAG: glycosyltransferase family 39 protein [Candidatus Kerfeldbacteria bacterium]|nr:glycosyltransferase family 39 protein [Candidatus Kerfeldbacteria bacterium]
MPTVNRRVASVGLLVGVLLVSGLLLWLGAVEDSQTADEATYVVSGLSYWRTGDWRLNVEHPPLLKLLFGLPLVAAGVPFTPDASDWAGASQWDIVPKALFGSAAPGHELLVSARVVNIVLTLALVLVAAILANKTWGQRAAILAVVLVAFEPNVLANGHLATTDIGYTLAMLSSILTFGWWLERWTWTRLVAAAAAFGLALLTRFNAVSLIVILPLLYAIARLTAGEQVRLSPRQAVSAILLFAVVSFIVIWAGYGFEFRVLDQVQDQSARQLLESLGRFGRWMQSVPLPAASYVSGFLWQIVHNQAGQPAYLFGQASQTGWWYYFPAAMLVKLTLGSLLLAALSLWVARWRRPGSAGRVFSGWYVGTALIGLLLLALPSRLNLGVRYVLPSIVLLMVLAAGVVRARWRWPRIGVGVVIALTFWHVASVVRLTPTFLPYANEAFGGPSKLYRHLIDSNLDWGQDLVRVRRYLAAHGLTDYYFRSFTTAPAAAYGLREIDIPTDDQVVTRPVTNVVVVGQSYLYYPGQRLEWLKRLKPSATIGHATNLYDLPSPAAD